MQHITIEAALHRIMQRLSAIPVNLGQVSEEHAAASLTPKTACNYIDVLSLCINHLLQVMQSVATNHKMLSDDGGYKF
jgi:hypothetical protein